MNITGFDHIVLVVAEVETTIRFYRDFLGMEAREERPGKWALHFGSNKISLQSEQSVPEIAANTTRGSANFCLLTDTPVADIEAKLQSNGIEILTGPAERIGATGKILSIYFHDPDGNLVEVSNQI